MIFLNEMFMKPFLLKGAPKLHPKIIFVSATKVGENVINILTAIFLNKYSLWHIKLNSYM